MTGCDSCFTSLRNELIVLRTEYDRLKKHCELLEYSVDQYKRGFNAQTRR